MRRTDLEVTDRRHMQEILESCPIVHLGYVDDGEPYVVPMNFGLDMDEEHCVLYFHSAREGRKIDIMRRNPRICIEASLYRPDPATSHTIHTMRYQSVIGLGRAVFVEDAEEKMQALELISRHSGKKGKGCSPEKAVKVCVFKVVVDSLSCKERRDREKPAQAAGEGTGCSRAE